ncbi:polyketide cyclase/dehydrase/lipid transport protein [Streptomyces sp. 1114.5]|uniref:SRPBCC family protein n=1 Tax=unclassified Streptomyces TaxID=2593676 RepID=UPI000BC4ECEE|nr:MULTISPECIES: SRPBCC family protein [unclassified Streptomyces]RKT18539.1 polyketide cyclase/dehydrase/lipid transport protein [Streptomyces sp. 1114.5]SOB84741.1 Polyketide cyclase / dehydrase and lipid transport [Streptomyces sp. 1331.2]
MAETKVSTVVEAPADQVWELIGDFHRLGHWHPHLPESTPGNDLPGNAIGSVRVFDLDGTVLYETLLAYDEEARSHTYSFPDGTFHFDNYRATLRVTPITELNASFVEWNASYDVAAEHHKESTEQVHGVFTSGLAALREHFAG